MWLSYNKFEANCAHKYAEKKEKYAFEFTKLCGPLVKHAEKAIAKIRFTEGIVTTDN